MSAANTLAELTVAGMACAPVCCEECQGRLCDEVGAIDGVESVDCARAGTMTIAYDPRRVSPGDLARLVDEARLRIAEGYAHAAYRLTGLD